MGSTSGLAWTDDSGPSSGLGVGDGISPGTGCAVEATTGCDRAPSSFVKGGTDGVEEDAELVDTAEFAEVTDAAGDDIAIETSTAEVLGEETEPELIEQSAANPMPAAPMLPGVSEDDASDELEIETSARSEELNDVELD